MLSYHDSILQERWNKKIPEIHVKDPTYWSLYDSVMSGLYLEKEKDIWLDKTQLVWRQIPDFLENFPEGKAIIVIRNPKAVLASFKQYTHAPEPLYLGAIFNMYDSMKHAEMYEREYQGRYITIRYEDIMDVPQFMLPNIYSFLGLDCKHDLLDTSSWKDAKGEPWKNNTVYGYGKRYNPKDSLNKWKSILEPWEKHFCDQINANYNILYDYPSTKAESTEIPEKAFDNEKIQRYLKTWLFKKEGIQEFPTDPFSKKNWSENR